MLKVRDLQMVRNRRTILNIDNIELAEGEFVAIIGRNGAGKTSLINALGLLADFKCSAYIYRGVPVNIKAERLSVVRQYSHVYQRTAFLNGDVLYNVALPLLIRGAKRNVALQAALKWLTLVQAEHLAKRAPHTLSGGEGARVSLARALVTEPAVLFFDEPFSGLDIESLAYILRHLRAWLAESNTTGILVTHSYNEVAHLADRLIVMDAGKIGADGPPGKVLANTSTNFLRDFVAIGSYSLQELNRPKNGNS